MSVELSSASVFPLGLQLILAGGWLVIVSLVAVGVHRYANAGSEVTRKVVHIGTGNIILIAWWLQIPAWVGMLASVVFSIVTLVSYQLPILPSINNVGRYSLGTFFYALSIGILIFCFWAHSPQYAVLGILVMTWGDGLAALVGKNFGQHPYYIWGIQKSWEGSCTMAGVSCLVSYLVLMGIHMPLEQAGLVALGVAPFAAVVEAFSKFGIDNLTVPVGSAFLAFGIHQAAAGVAPSLPF